MGVVFAYISLVFALIILPITYIIVISRPLHQLSAPEFREKWDSFYAESRLSSHWSLLFNCFSVLRRLHFVLLAIFVSVPSLQIVGVIGSNYVILCY